MAIQIISRKEAASRVNYHPHHLVRMEKVGRFPRSVVLGPGRRGYVEGEVEAWIEERIAERDARCAEPVEAATE